jgi:hypothetical protein
MSCGQVCLEYSGLCVDKKETQGAWGKFAPSFLVLKMMVSRMWWLLEFQLFCGLYEKL